MTEEITELKEKFEKYLKEQDEKEEKAYTLSEAGVVIIFLGATALFLFGAVIIALISGDEIGVAVCYIVAIIFFVAAMLYQKLERNSQQIHEVYKLLENDK